MHPKSNVPTQPIKTSWTKDHTSTFHIPLTQNHRQAYEWAMNYVGWNRNDRRTVFFTNEPKYYLDYTDNGVKKNLESYSMQPTLLNKIASDCLGGISLDGHIELCVLQCGTLNAHRYIDENLELAGRMLTNDM